MPRKKHFDLTYHHVFEGFIIRIIPTNHPLVSVQLLNKSAVLDFFQDRRIDEVTGVESFHLRPGLGELIYNGLNSFAVGVGSSTDQSLRHLVIRLLYQGQIVETRVLFEDVQRKVFVRFEDIDALDISFHESDDDIPISLNEALSRAETMH